MVADTVTAMTCAGRTDRGRHAGGATYAALEGGSPRAHGDLAGAGADRDGTITAATLRGLGWPIGASGVRWAHSNDTECRDHVDERLADGGAVPDEAIGALLVGRVDCDLCAEDALYSWTVAGGMGDGGTWATPDVADLRLWLEVRFDFTVGGIADAAARLLRALVTGEPSDDAEALLGITVRRPSREAQLAW